MAAATFSPEDLALLRQAVRALAIEHANKLRAARFQARFTDAAELEQHIRELLPLYVKLDGDTLDTTPDSLTSFLFPVMTGKAQLQVIK